MNAFFRGLAAGQAAREHEQQLEASRLQQQLLKFRLQGLQLEDKLRTYDVKQKHAELQFAAQNGRPLADMDTEAVTQQGPPVEGNASGLQGPQGLQGVLLQQFHGRGPAIPTAGPETLSGPGPAAITVTQQPRAIQYPGLPAELGGGAGFTRRPRSREDLTQEAIRLKRAEAQPQIVPPESSVYGYDQATGKPGVLYTNPNQRNKPAEQQLLEALRSGDVDGAQRILDAIAQVAKAKNTGRAQRPLVVNGRVLDPNDPSKVITTVPPQVNPNVETPQDRADRREYEDFVRQWDEKQRTTLQYPPDVENDPMAKARARRERAPYVPPPSQADWIAAGKPNVKQVEDLRKRKAERGGVANTAPAPDRHALTVTDPATGRTFKFDTPANAEAFRRALGLTQ
jgi:hypothetical protein